MGKFEKGNKLGHRFTSTDQPKKNGRKPSLYKQLRKLTGKTVGFELEREDYYAVIRYLMEQDVATLEKICYDGTGANRKPKKDMPIWVLNVVSAINADTRYGRTTTVEMLLDRVFGKAVQPIESDVNVSSVVGDLGNLSDEELVKYNELLEKIQCGSKEKPDVENG